MKTLKLQKVVEGALKKNEKVSFNSNWFIKIGYRKIKYLELVPNVFIVIIKNNFIRKFKGTIRDFLIWFDVTQIGKLHFSFSFDSIGMLYILKVYFVKLKYIMASKINNFRYLRNFSLRFFFILKKADVFLTQNSLQKSWNSLCEMLQK